MNNSHDRSNSTQSGAAQKSAAPGTSQDATTESKASPRKPDTDPGAKDASASKFPAGDAKR